MRGNGVFDQKSPGDGKTEDLGCILEAELSRLADVGRGKESIYE